jgi:hypothetical protein
MELSATGPAKEKAVWNKVARKDVAALFKEHYPRGPWPTESECYHLANAIDIVRNKEPLPVKNATPRYRDSRRLVDAMSKLIKEQIDSQQFGGLRLPPLVRLEELQRALDLAKTALLAPAHPLAGERKGAEWHWPAHFLAGYVEETLRAANPRKYRDKKISRDKRGGFVLVVGGALKLAGLDEQTPDAIAAALKKGERIIAGGLVGRKSDHTTAGRLAG